MLNRGALKDLFEKYLSGACSPEEIEFLFRQFDLPADEEALRSLIEDTLLHEMGDDATLQPKVAAFTERVGERLAKEIAPRRRMTPWMKIAAILTVFLSIGVLVYFLVQKERAAEPKQEISAYGGEVSPGGNRATLTLSSGEVVDLSPEHAGIVVEKEIVYADGTVVASPQQGEKKSAVPQSLTLATPKGGTYQVTLPDGSKVWLNSASSLTYPSEFGDQPRVVELEGEAYFQVATWRPSGSVDKVPFVVKTHGQEIEVLGTQFNVSAYKEEEETKTTLVEGKVKVLEALSGTSMQLKPNQQATLRKGKLSVKEVEVGAFIEWKDGLFSFQETSLRDAMNQLSRWYDLTVTYEGEVSDTYFFGKIKRDNSLSNVLNILRKSGLNFRVENKEELNRLIVLP